MRRGSVEVEVDAPPSAVWRVVSDVTRVGEWSHECQGADWLAGATSAAPGARFRGRNKTGRVGWARVCEIIAAAEPRELVWRTLPTLLYPDGTEWRIQLEPTAGGTRIRQSYRVLRLPAFFDWLYSTMIPSHRDRTAALAEDLRRLGALARRDSERQLSVAL